MSRFACGLAVLLAVPFGIRSGLAAPVPRDKPAKPEGPNSNALVEKHRADLKYGCSSEWGGWPTANAFDGKQETSWYSLSGDCKSGMKDPWVEVTFPEDVKVSRVTVLGNRDPQYPTGYTCLAGRLELFDADGKLIAKMELGEGAGEKKDFDFVPAARSARVRTVRFTSTNDQSTANGYTCVALSEVQVE